MGGGDEEGKSRPLYTFTYIYILTYKKQRKAKEGYSHRDKNPFWQTHLLAPIFKNTKAKERFYLV